VKTYHRHRERSRFPISFGVIPHHFRMTLRQPKQAANRQSYFVAPGGGFLHQILGLGRTRRDSAKREGWEMGDYGESLIP